MKKGYLIVRINIKNAELFQQYPPLSTKAVEKFGGKYLIRGGSFEIAEGQWPAGSGGCYRPGCGSWLRLQLYHGQLRVQAHPLAGHHPV